MDLRAAAPLFDTGLSVLAADKDLLLCDVWGVIHNGVAHHGPAVDALRRFRSGGGTIVLVTNAPAPERQVQARLDSLAVPRDAYDRIATSGDVTAAVLAAAGCPPVFNIGPDEDLAIYREAERLGPRAPRRVGVDDAEIAVCVAPDSTGPRPQDYDGVLRRLRDRRLDLVCANPDIVVEMGDRLLFCAGAIAERYESIGGAVIHAGKPFPAIYERALAMAAAIRGSVTPPERILAIGDAMHTDIAGAAGQGIDALMITSGIHRGALHGGAHGAPLDRAALDRLLADANARPFAVLPGLGWR